MKNGGRPAAWGRRLQRGGSGGEWRGAARTLDEDARRGCAHWLQVWLREDLQQGAFGGDELLLGGVW